MALSEQASVLYLCSAPYAAGREHAVRPLDPDIGIAWPRDVEAMLSDKDAAATPLVEAHSAGLLPDYGECVAYAARLRAGGGGDALSRQFRARRVGGTPAG